MNSVVAKKAGGVESVKSVCAKYNKRIARLQQMMKIRKEQKVSTEDAEKIAYGIIVDLGEETRLPPAKVNALYSQVRALTPSITLNIESADTDRYGDGIVALYVASRYSMRKIANELGINVSTVSRHVRKWAEQNAELRGGLATAREVELARLDEMLARENSRYGGGNNREKLQILDRKYRLLGLSSSGPQVVVGIGVQQGQQGRQPRVIDGVAHDISDESE